MPKEGQNEGAEGAGAQEHGAADAIEAASEPVGVTGRPRPADAGGEWPVGEDAGLSSPPCGKAACSDDTAGGQGWGPACLRATGKCA